MPAFIQADCYLLGFRKSGAITMNSDTGALPIALKALLPPGSRDRVGYHRQECGAGRSPRTVPVME